MQGHGVATGNIIATIITIQTDRKSGGARPIVGPIATMSMRPACQRSMPQAIAANASKRPRMRFR